MKWDKKDQAIFECADKGLTELMRMEWLTRQEYIEISKIIQKAIESKEELHNDDRLFGSIKFRNKLL